MVQVMVFILAVGVLLYAVVDLFKRIKPGQAKEGHGVAKERATVAYLTQRRALGVLGVALPLVLAVWGFTIKGFLVFQDSISAYYDLRTRDVFVGFLFAIAWFLFSYKGYDDQDDRAGDWACLFALAVALFPYNGAQSVVHFAAAFGFFLTLSYFCLVLFIKSGADPVDQTEEDKAKLASLRPGKTSRNNLYKACGYTILGCIGLIGLIGLLRRFEFLPEEAFVFRLHPTFWLESFALWAFGASWLVKGEWLWKDPIAVLGAFIEWTPDDVAGDPAGALTVADEEIKREGKIPGKKRIVKAMTSVRSNLGGIGA